MDKQKHVINELNRLPTKKEAGENIIVLCPYHKESNPSFSVNIVSNKKIPLGWGRCWACGASKHWNDHSQKLGLKPFKKGVISDEYIQRRNKADTLVEKIKPLSFQDLKNQFECPIYFDIDDKDTWRGFSGKFLSEFDIKVSVDLYGKDCIIIPIYNQGIMVGGIKAFNRKRKKFTSYLNYPGVWVRDKGLFPYDYVDNMLGEKGLDYVILCEGPRDALSLIEKGYPALAVLGTQTFSDSKLKQIRALGINKIVIFMDSGKPGIAATNKILKIAKGKVKRIAVKTGRWKDYYEEKTGKELEELDPNSCPAPLLNKILKWIESKV